MALPFLDIMRPSRALAKSASVKPPVRTAFFYIPNGVVQSAWHPVEIGQGFKLSPTLQPLEPVREKVSVFTKLDRIKVAGTDGHAQAGACWLSSAAPDELFRYHRGNPASNGSGSDPPFPRSSHHRDT